MNDFTAEELQEIINLRQIFPPLVEGVPMEITFDNETSPLIVSRLMNAKNQEIEFEKILSMIYPNSTGIQSTLVESYDHDKIQREDEIEFFERVDNETLDHDDSSEFINFDSLLKLGENELTIDDQLRSPSRFSEDENLIPETHQVSNEVLLLFNVLKVVAKNSVEALNLIDKKLKDLEINQWIFGDDDKVDERVLIFIKAWNGDISLEQN